MNNIPLAATDIFVDAAPGRIIVSIKTAEKTTIEVSLTPEKAKEIGSLLIFQAGKATEREK